MIEFSAMLQQKFRNRFAVACDGNVDGRAKTTQRFSIRKLSREVWGVSEIKQ
jgi:hypothetical protein